MKIKVIEKSARDEIATESSLEKALQTARRKRLLPDNVLFVVGEPDVQIHDFSASWASLYRWLANYLIRQSAEEYFIEAAKSRLIIWDAIARSREVRHEDIVAPHLADSVGVTMAGDIQLLLRLHRGNDSVVCGPDTKSKWAEAVEKGNGLVKRFRNNNYVLAVHEVLGAIVVAPDVFFQERPGFKIKRYMRNHRTI